MTPSSEKIRKVIGNIIALEKDGSVIPDQRVMARHPALADELPDALQSLNAIRSAEIQSKAAGDIEEPLEVCSEQELNAPLTFDDSEFDVNAASSGFSESIVGYRLFELIGRGGQASVYRAQKNSTDGIVAIKVLPGGFFTSSRARARFDREASALVRINHPNVVPVLDKGRTRDGSLFIVMAFIEGLPPDQYFAINRDERRVAAVFSKIASAVHEMHSQKIVHRDLKPSNVLIDRHGEPHILDFGLARLAESHSVTDTGQILGSLPWASPEQATGQSTDVNELSDIYSLGVMLAVVLDGQPPYPTNGGLLETARHIIETPPVVGRDRPPGRLDGIALKCLAKKPSERYASASELAAQLLSVERGTTPRAIAKVRHLRRSTIFAFAGSLSLVVVSIVGYSAYRQAETASRTDKTPPVIDAVVQLPTVSNSLGMRFVKIPSGDFLMERSNQDRRRLASPETLQHIRRPFYLACTETTRGQYQSIMSDKASLNSLQDPDIPAGMITLANALEFCRRLNQLHEGKYRLPTTIEWEWACQAAPTAKNLAEDELDSVAWNSRNSRGVLHPVATRRPNRWGLYDMLGSVAEWCVDSDSIQATGSSPVYPSALKGGSFTRPAFDCNVAEERLNPVDIPFADAGFRVVWEDPQGK